MSPGPAAPTAPRRRGWGGRLAWAGLVVAVLGAASGWQVLPAPGQWGSRFATNPGDPVFLMWAMTEQSHHLTALLQGNIFFPHADALAYSDSAIAYLPVFGPALRLTGDNPVAAYNAVAVAGYLAGALAVYALAQHLLDRPAALVAALLFSIAPYRSAAVGHVQLVGVCFVVLALLFTMRFLERRRWIDAALVGAMAGLGWLGSLYCAMMLAVVLPAFVGVWLLLRWRSRGPRLWRGLGLAALLTALLAGPTLPAYVRVERTGLITRRAGELITAKPASFTALPPSGLYHLLGRGQVLFDRTALYPGTLLLLLAAAGSIAALAALGAALGRVDRRRDPGLAAALRAASAALRAQVGDDPAGLRRREYALPLLAAGLVCMAVMVGPNRTPLLSEPDRLLRAVVPGMASVRDLTRFWLVPLLLLALLAGAGERELALRMRRRGGTAALAAGLVLVAGAELLYRPDWSGVDLSPARTAAERTLGGLPPGAVVELPLPVPDTFDYAFTVAPEQLRSLVDEHPRVEGYSGEIPGDVRLLIAEAQRLPDATALGTLRGAGVRYLLLHGAARPCAGEYGPEEMAGLLAGLSTGGAVERVLRAGSDAVVVLRPPAAAGEGSPAHSAPPPRPRQAPGCDLD